MNFLKIIFWEYLQNLPIMTGFVWGLKLWQGGRYGVAAGCVILGSVVGAILIALTEGKKVPGFREPRSVLVTNIIVIIIIMLLVMVYLTERWSSWLTDLGVGILSGAGLAVLQSLAAKGKIGLIHCIALGTATPLVLISIRWLVSIGLSIWLNIALLSLLGTLVISVIDYLPDKLKKLSD